MKKLSVIALFLIALAVSSCETTGPKQESGAVIGAVAGGLIGSQFGNGAGRVGATLLGAAVGGLIGGGIGSELDAQDRARMAQITTASIHTGASRSFRTKNGGKASTKVIKVSKEEGKLCRTVQQEVTLAGGGVSRDTVSGCKGPNGWDV